LALLAAGLAFGVQKARNGPPGTDVSLYVRVIEDVRAGQDYYAATAREQRAARYPLRPFVTVRLPTLAEGLTRLPDAPARRTAARLLALAVVGAWTWRLRDLAGRPLSAAFALVMLLGSAAPALYPSAYVQHELWSGLLLSLSLAVYAPRRWAASLLLALLALSIRELAAPFLAVMGLMALRDRRPGEAAAWAGGLVAFAAGLAWHAHEVARVTTAADLASDGWTAWGGWPFVLLGMKWNAWLLALPDAATALAAALAALGAAGLWAERPALGARLTLALAAYALAFMAVGRSDNSYWGLMIAPLWPVALAGVGQGVKAARRPA
jgi:hypothetical protein